MRSFLIFLTALFPVAAAAQVVHDGSLGQAGPVPGQTLRLIVPGEGANAFGKIVGQNVFYSFKQFDLAKNETARFLDPQNRAIRNILARVTSGKNSSIDGTIELTDPQVNLFMMNPAGFIFGPNAKLDVQGSVLFTSADYIKLADDVRFDAKVQVSPVLSSAAPAAFGFLGAQASGAIRINGSNDQTAPTTLEVPSGAVLSFVGGDIDASAVRVRATGGRINLVSGAGAGEAKFDAADAISSIDVSGLPSRGAITLRDSASIRAAVGGRVTIRGGSLLLANSSIVAETDVVAGGSVDIDVSGKYESASSQINVATQGPADAGDVVIRADQVVLRGNSIEGGLTAAISAESGEAAAGQGGDVTITARTIDISDHASIVASTNHTGDGGNVTLIASERVTLDGSTGPQPLTGIISETVTTESEAGDAGDVTITAPLVQILSNAQITSRTKSFGSAGKVEIDADQLLIDGSGTGVGSFTGIEARVGDNFGIEENNLGAPGAGGIVKIDADQITLRNGGVITASTFGIGNAGGMQITVDRLVIRGSTRHRFTGLFARTTKATQAGQGGNIELTAGSIDMFGRASISASSELSDGDAGGIIINSSGPISLDHGAAINVSSDRVNAGNIDITTRDSLALTDNSRIAGSAKGNGGVVNIIARNLSLSRSLITGEAGLTGGTITVNSKAVSLGASTINGRAGGRDVRVDINGRLLQAVDSAILSDNTNFTIDTDLASALVPFNADIAGVTARLQDFCGIRISEISSFTITGRGGLTLDPAHAAPASDR
ncbi:MAG: filamentous hemagglutinin N-terminal domain-containing protein [Anaerolineae bacterium]|nr:filamentous hemagglutinin N-terminal domain-containing protein [Phycisphaerae bacterium]